MPEEHRAFVRAAQRQIGVGDHADQIRVDPQGRRRENLQVIAKWYSRGRFAATAAAAGIGSGTAHHKIENIARGVDASRPDSLFHRHRSAERWCPDVASDREIGVDRRANPFRVAQMHVRAPDRHVQIAGQIALQANPPAELHAPSPHRRRHVVQTDSARVELDRAVDGIERVRHQHVTHAAVHDSRAAGEQGLVQRSVDGRPQLGATGAAHVAEQALQDAQVGVSRALKRNAPIVEADRARDAQPRVFADHFELSNPDDVLVEREANRRGVPQRVIEQADVQRVDGAFDEQVIDIR